MINAWISVMPGLLGPEVLSNIEIDIYPRAVGIYLLKKPFVVH